MTLEVEVERLDPRTLRCRLRDGGAALSFAVVLERWGSDTRFAREFGARLAEAPFEACFWELPPLRPDQLERPYEHVMVESPSLATVAADPGPFAPHFSGAPAVRFDSLRGDAHLVAPCPIATDADYTHLLSFVRTAPAAQIEALFGALGHAAASLLERRPWISTSGLGVHWLHLRLDSRPKYYAHAPYRAALTV